MRGSPRGAERRGCARLRAPDGRGLGARGAQPSARNSRRSRRSPRSDETPIKPERVVADAAGAAAAGCRRSSPTRARLARISPPTTWCAAGRPALHLQPRARRARLCACRRRSARRSAGRAVKSVAVMGDGSFGMCVGRARDRRAAASLPITLRGDLERGLRLDQGRAEEPASAGATSRSTFRRGRARQDRRRPIGVRSWRVAEPADSGRRWRRRWRASGPTLVDVV